MKTSIGLATVTGLVAALLPMAAFAQSGGSHKPAPNHAPATVVSQDKHCTLSPSMSAPKTDTASCISVGARLSTIPQVGHRALLHITVKAARNEPNTEVAVNLPRTFALVGGAPTHHAFTGAGAVQRASVATLNMRAGQTRTLTEVVQAVRSGYGEISVTAQNRLSATRTDGGTDSVFATTGQSAATTFAGAGAAHNGSTVGGVARANYTAVAPNAAVPTHPVALPATHHPATQVSSNGLHANTAGQACATGKWFYVDQASVTRPANDVTVNVIRSGTVVASGFTSPSDASYNLCWSTGGASQTVSVQFVESNSVWTLVNLSSAQYKFATGAVTIPDGGTHDFGSLQPSDSTVMRGLHAYQEANDEYQWIYRRTSYIGGCWSPFETTCRQLVIHWQSDSTTGTFWNSTGAYLLAGSPDTLDEPVHEYGHALMYGLYGETFPATTNCNPHFLFTASSTTCGWTEGWADWVATSVYNNMVWTFNGGSTTSFNVTWNEGLGFDTGDQVEGRIVMAMRSLTDGVKGPWDNDPGEGAGTDDNRNFFAVLHTYKPNTFGQFWSDRALAGQDVSQTALSALYEGTIDYGFRNPLHDYAGVHFPEAVPDHNYSHTTTTGYWSAVAVRPDSGSDVDLSLYNDFNETALLGSSAFGGTTTDFVAINSNSGHRALQTYYARAHQFAGSGGYTIEDAQGSNSLTSGSSTFAFGSTQPIRIFDSFQSVGVPVFYRAVPTSGLDVQLFATPAASDIVSRSASTGGADPGVSQPATLTFTPASTGWHGLIVLNNGLTSGSVTVYADTSAPTGTLTINGGATRTTDPNVSLALSASDAQTGVTAMQISTDGTFDTEPVVPFATSATATLPSGLGSKTVSVRYENNAGMWSTPVTSTIDVVAPPAVTSVSPVSGPLGGGKTVTINGSGFTGATAVAFGSAGATALTVVSDTKITVQSPAHAAGTVNVTVTASGATSATSAHSAYTYQAKAKVTGVSDNSGSHNGGKTITITGKNFIGASAVKFGSKNAANYTVVSATKITAKTPAHAAGTVHVTVKTPSGTSATSNADKFTFN